MSRQIDIGSNVAKVLSQRNLQRWFREAELDLGLYRMGVFFPKAGLEAFTKALLKSGNRVCVSRSVVSDSLWSHGLQPARLLCPWDSPGKNTGVSSLSLLQVIFPTEGWNPGLLHCRQILYHLSHHREAQSGNIYALMLLLGPRNGQVEFMTLKWIGSLHFLRWKWKILHLQKKGP